MKIKQTKIGKNQMDLEITCEISGLPIDRTNDNGMFCSAKDCKCEIESQKAMMKMQDFMADLMENFPPNIGD